MVQKCIQYYTEYEGYELFLQNSNINHKNYILQRTYQGKILLKILCF